MKRLITALMCIFLFAETMGQNSSIEGKVMDDQGLGIPGITVRVKGANKGSFTNAKGFFNISGLEQGTYILVFSGIGFESNEMQVKLENGQVLRLNDETLKESLSQLNEVIISGGNTGIKEIPGSVHVISQKELEKFNYTDVNRVLSMVPGVNIQEEDGFGLRPNIGLRASGVERSSKITLMEDGILMAPAPYVAPSAYYFPTMGRMSGIEVLKGSSQICYGPYTTGGAINLISSPIPNDFSLNAEASYGSFDTYQAHVNIGNTNGRISYILESFHYGSGGFKKLDKGGPTGFDKSDYIAKMRLRLSKNNKLDHSVELKLGKTSENSFETYLGLSRDDFGVNPYRRYTGSQKDVMNSNHEQLSIRHTIVSKGFRWHSVIYQNTFDRNWYKLDKVSDSTGVYGISDILDDPIAYDNTLRIIKGGNSQSGEQLHVKANNRTYFSRGLQTQLTYVFNHQQLTGKLNTGIRIHQDGIDRFQWVDAYSMNQGLMILTTEGRPGSESNSIEQAKAIASWAKIHLQKGRMSITPGIRYESIFSNKKDYGKRDPDRNGTDLIISGNSVNILIPGIGLNYQAKKWLDFLLGIHRGFAPAGSTPGALPESSVNYELGLRVANKSLEIQVTCFYNNYKNLLGTDNSSAGGSGSGSTFNGGAAETHGLEASIAYNLVSNQNQSKLSLPVSMNYTYSSAHFLSTFNSDFEGWGQVEKWDELPYLAEHRIGLNVGVEYQKLAISSLIRYVSRMRSLPGQGGIPENELIPEYLIMDISCNYRINSILRFFINCTNLTDNDYLVSLRPSGLRPGMPRCLMLGVRLGI